MERFDACQDAARTLYEFECSLYDSNILSEKRTYDHIPALERTLLELASDPHLTSGVVYCLTITSIIDHKSKKKLTLKYSIYKRYLCIFSEVTITRYFESGRYMNFMRYSGNRMLNKDIPLPERSLNYRIYTKEDIEKAPFKSKTLRKSN